MIERTLNLSPAASRYTTIASNTQNENIAELEIEYKPKNVDDTIQPNPTKEKVNEMVESLNKFLNPTQTALKFEFHEKLHEYYVTIVDSNTNELIKEIPPKKMLDLYAQMTEFLGIMVDKKI
ncbi:flagellar protein FlaG [Peribacillus deserti]|uniref:Flagellar biosynthesis protein FlaG n=1 Tax=Peribacillus deserti TaxID=673318 RepID=A0A2N5M9T4_9BACI|nr:flagellar protein FlaG [Peribacillus deserti]PLT31073.1 flagellar biosynthesis protein FlaG [Peribacillus deserti]